MPHIALINAAAGVRSGTDRVAAARAALAAAGVDAEVRAVEGAGMESAALRALGEGADLLIVGGGDGSVGAVASAVAGTAATLGVLSMGTFNHFARDLGIPPRVEHAARLIARGPAAAKPVDVGEVTDAGGVTRRFVNNGSIGLYPHIVSQRQRLQERVGRGKLFALFAATLSVFRRYPLLTVVIDTGDAALMRTTPFVFVGNNCYEMHLLAENGRPALDRAELGVYFTRRTGRFGLLRIALRGLFGRLDQSRDFESLTLPELTIDTPKKTLRIALDGEVTRMTPPLKFRVLPGMLKVIAGGGDGMTKPE